MARFTATLRLVATLLSFCAIGVRCQGRMCYALDGTEYPFDVPCTNDEVTVCCNSKDICMSNGLCYLQGSHGSVLSRGSCTDKNWGPGCFAPCSSYHRHIGFPIVNFGFQGKDSKYCCGGFEIVDGKVGCLNGDSTFSLPPGQAIVGVAGLVNNSSPSPTPTSTASTTSTTSTTSTGTRTTGTGTSTTATGTNTDLPPTPTDTGSPVHTTPPVTTCPSPRDTVIGVGIGVPLGVIAIAALAWAIWERSGRRQALAAASAGGAVYSAQTEYAHPPHYQKPVAELSERGVISELMGSGHHNHK
ncbi:hypothetical protein RJZ56_005092 [Blastomyces dermatitidis]|uniref:Uncharacterized protein n=1 Tax=Ajellomyces dermatitidis (strain ER-3 / ATCC MYA-2586) TaxID=559297 RepID=A0ABP2F6W3_AJEDR|nr:uncharacterized protein BDCG_07585 [Blastomyces dermatitidis ER-3]XP_045282217.1 hypothetical protein, variant [Blastomyces dermatitidis ER-3]EEQ92465.1 hypothetical protein BDCG_07585 [Blastomyces dermatitidis ER-3]OAT02490.1 hypothetical protein, variant [Blastomyces dermatitidis ER-3]